MPMPQHYVFPEPSSIGWQALVTWINGVFLHIDVSYIFLSNPPYPIATASHLPSDNASGPMMDPPTYDEAVDDIDNVPYTQQSALNPNIKSA